MARPDAGHGRAVSTCDHRTGGRYCPDCGLDFRPAPYDRSAFVNELVENWWEKGVVRTFLGLFIRPGIYLRAYVEHDRKLLLKPLSYAAVMIALVYWARSRIPGMGTFDTSDSATLTLLMRDPIIVTLLAAVTGALVITYVTHRHAPLSIYGAIVVRLYLSVQLMIMLLAIDIVAVQLALRGSAGHTLVRFGVNFGWLTFALWQFFGPDRLRRPWLRAFVAVLLGEAAVFLLLILPIAIVDELGWLN